MPLKTYVLTVSQVFPKHHPKAGQPTNFPQAIKQYEKIHTIRDNYVLWKKRIDQVNEGKAVLSVRVWVGPPYHSRQIEIFRYNKSNNIGIQSLQKLPLGWFVDGEYIPTLYTSTIAKNDGLSLPDFNDWFKVFEGEKAIIHFTDFRYREQAPMMGMSY